MKVFDKRQERIWFITLMLEEREQVLYIVSFTIDHESWGLVSKNRPKFWAFFPLSASFGLGPAYTGCKLKQAGGQEW